MPVPASQPYYDRRPIEARQIDAFVHAADREMIEVGGYGLTEAGRADIKQDAREIYTSQ